MLAVTGMLVVLAAAPFAEAACPVPDRALGSPIAQRFEAYLGEHFPMLRGDRSLSGTDRAILVGYALGRQAPAVGDDAARREAFECLLVALEQATYWQAIASGPMVGFAVANDSYRTMYAAAMGMHDDRVFELTGYHHDTPLPSVFDGPAVVDGGSDRFVPAAIDAYRDGLLADGFGPDRGPNGGGCPPADGTEPYAYFAAVPWPHIPCYALGGSLWCCANYRWDSVASTDGVNWAMSSLRGGPACAFTTTRQADDGWISGTATCPDGHAFNWNVHFVQ